MRTLALAAALFAVACHHSPPVTAWQFMTPEGRPGWFIDCRESQMHCLHAAQQRCPWGYVIVPNLNTGDQSGVAAQTTYGRDFWGRPTASGVAAPVYRSTMAIECRQPVAPAASAAPAEPVAQPHGQ